MKLCLIFGGVEEGGSTSQKTVFSVGEVNIWIFSGPTQY